MHAFLLPPVVAGESSGCGGQRVVPGDVFIHNDPFHGGNHAMDVSIVRPFLAGS